VFRWFHPVLLTSWLCIYIH